MTEGSKVVADVRRKTFLKWNGPDLTSFWDSNVAPPSAWLFEIEPRRPVPMRLGSRSPSPVNGSITPNPRFRMS